MVKLFVTVGQSLELSQSYQYRLNRKWNKIVSSPFACIPHEKVGKVGLEEVITENTKLGEFATTHLKEIFRQSTEQDIIRRMKDGKKVVAVGFGRNYDSEWLAEASLAGYQTWWIDVSDVACDMAAASMKSQYEKLSAGGVIYPAPIIKQGEIRSILADPTTIELDLSSVEVWYFCRTLNCLSVRSAMLVLLWLGESTLSADLDPEGNNKIEIVAAMRDYNPGRVGRMSHLYPLKKILNVLEQGANRPLTTVGEASHKYFDQIYTAVTIRAKQSGG